MQIIDTDSINYPFVQICVIGGVFYLVLAKASCKSIPKAAATPYHMPDLPCNNCVCGVA